MGNINFIHVAFNTNDPCEVATILKDLTEALSQLKVRLFSVQFTEGIPIVPLEKWVGTVPIYKNTFAFFALAPVTNHMLNGMTSELMENAVFLEAYTDESVPQALIADLRRAFRNVLIERFPRLFNVAVWK